MDTKLACLTTSIGSSIQVRSLFRGYCCWITDKRNKAPASTASSRPGPPSRLDDDDVVEDDRDEKREDDNQDGESNAGRDCGCSQKDIHRSSTPRSRSHARIDTGNHPVRGVSSWQF